MVVKYDHICVNTLFIKRLFIPKAFAKANENPGQLIPAQHIISLVSINKKQLALHIKASMVSYKRLA
jgi:hypothetical protein